MYEDDETAACNAELQPKDDVARWVSEGLPGSDLEVDCDSEGRLAFGPFLPSGYDVLVQPRPGLPLRARQSEAPGPDGDDLGVLRVDRGASFSVIVNDSDGCPVAKARVAVRGTAGIVVSAEGTTDDAGEVTLSGLPPHARIGLTVEASGFRDEHASGLSLDDSPYTVTLSAGAVASGWVGTPEGEAVEGAWVHLSATNRKDFESHQTGTDGSFRFEGFSPGPADLVAKAGGYRPSETLVLDLVEGVPREELELVVEPAPGIRGIVVDPEERPVAGARVGLAWPNNMDFSEPRNWLVGTASGRDGSFVLRYGPESGQRVFATAKGFGPAFGRSTAMLWGEEFLLRLTRPAELLVHLPPGLPPDAHVFVRGAHRDTYSSMVAGKTELLFEDLPAGAATVRLEPGSEERVRLIADETVEVTLGGGTVVIGTVAFEGEPVPRAVVHASRLDERGKLALGQFGPSVTGDYTDESGRYRLPAMGAGTYVLRAVADEGRAERIIEVAGKNEMVVDLEIEEIRLSVQVVDASNKDPVKGASVRIVPEGVSAKGIFALWRGSGPGPTMRAVADGGDLTWSGSLGKALLTVAKPGRYSITVDVGGAGYKGKEYESWSQTIDIVEGSNALVVELVPRERRVRVLLMTDPPGLRGNLTCTSRGWARASAHNVAFEAECSNMPSGPGGVVFHVPGFGVGGEPIDIPEEGEVVVTVRVRESGTLVIPEASWSTRFPVVRDAEGVFWNTLLRGTVGHFSQEQLPDVGLAWVFRLPPGTYEVVVDGETRSGIKVHSGQTTVAY